MLTILSLCACQASGAPKPQPNPLAHAADDKPAASVTSTTPASPLTPAVMRPQVNSGLVNLDGLTKIPSHAFVSFPNNATSGFRYTIINDQKTWNGLAVNNLAPNFAQQVVVLVAFDGQTNALAQPKWTQQGSHGNFTFSWLGIEPFYIDSTPAVYAAVQRNSLDQITFTATGMLMPKAQLTLQVTKDAITAGKGAKCNGKLDERIAKKRCTKKKSRFVP